MFVVRIAFHLKRERGLPGETSSLRSLRFNLSASCSIPDSFFFPMQQQRRLSEASYTCMLLMILHQQAISKFEFQS